MKKGYFTKSVTHALIINEQLLAQCYLADLKQSTKIAKIKWR